MKSLASKSFALLLLLLVGLFTSTGVLAVKPAFPILSGRVVDQANILSPPSKAELTKKLEALETRTSRQLVVVTVPSLQGLPIEDYGYQLGRAWGIGEKKRNTGVLLIVAPNERRVRIEVGYGLEAVLTDAVSSVILQERVLPRFRAGDVAGGVLGGADSLIDQLSLPDDQAKARIATAKEPGTASTSPFPLALVAIVVLWVVFGLIGTVGGRRGHRADLWLLPFMLFAGGGGHGRRGGGMGGMGGGGSFGGGGASGGW
jgi:uncharacterized protein